MHVPFFIWKFRDAEYEPLNVFDDPTTPDKEDTPNDSVDMSIKALGMKIRLPEYESFCLILRNIPTLKELDSA